MNAYPLSVFKRTDRPCFLVSFDKDHQLSVCLERDVIVKIHVWYDTTRGTGDYCYESGCRLEFFGTR